MKSVTRVPSTKYLKNRPSSHLLEQSLERLQPCLLNFVFVHTSFVDVSEKDMDTEIIPGTYLTIVKTLLSPLCGLSSRMDFNCSRTWSPSNTK